MSSLKADDKIYLSFLWDDKLQYPLYIKKVGLYRIRMSLSYGASIELGERFYYPVDPSAGRAIYKIREGVERQ